MSNVYESIMAGLNEAVEDAKNRKKMLKAETNHPFVTFDYTKWQREYFDAKTPEEISEEASCFEKNQPFISDAIRL